MYLKIYICSYLRSSVSPSACLSMRPSMRYLFPQHDADDDYYYDDVNVVVVLVVIAAYVDDFC